MNDSALLWAAAGAAAAVALVYWYSKRGRCACGCSGENATTLDEGDEDDGYDVRPGAFDAAAPTRQLPCGAGCGGARVQVAEVRGGIPRHRAAAPLAGGMGAR
jgi:hypothetical protein